MKLGEITRKTGFWCLDYCKGSSVGKHYREIKRYSTPTDEMVQLRYDRLQILIHHATKNTDHYRQYYGVTELADFPVLYKYNIKQDYSAFLSSGFSKSELIRIQTSGSYGSPFTFYLSKVKKSRQIAEIIFYNRQALFDLGAKHVNIVTRKKTKFQQYIENQVMVNAIFMDNQWLERQRVLLKKKNVRVIVAHPSALIPIAEYCESQKDTPDEFSFRSIITIAEPLYDKQKVLLKRVFGAKVFSRYSMMETGVIAQDHLSDGKFQVNTSSYIVELLDIERDIPVKPGQMGRVVVTDLFSHAMPLIRYDTGDLALLSIENDGILKLDRIIGRTVDSIYRPDGVRISPLWIDDVMDDMNSISLFQFVQKDRDKYLMRIVNKHDDSAEIIIEKRLRKYLGNNSTIDFEYVDEIPPLPSGKRPFVLNEYNTTNGN